MAADLHNHTTASDGTLSPGDLVRRAAGAGLSFLGITDHDTTGGLEAAHAAARDFAIRVVPGIELSTDATGREVHILGYFCQTEAGPLAERLVSLRESRRRRLGQMVERLREAGLELTQEVACQAGEGSPGRAHLARALVARGHAATMADAFERFLARGRPGYVPREKLHPLEAVRLVRASGGVAVLAHPGLMGDDTIIPSLVEAGLGGLEVIYPEHDGEQRDRYGEMARRFGLIATGGSDFHGVGERLADVGAARVPDQVVEELAARARL